MTKTNNALLVQRGLDGKFSVRGAEDNTIYYTDIDTFEEARKLAHTFIDNIGFDPVKKPEHYNSGKYEVIDMIESILSSLKVTPFQAYCLGNTLKYIARAGLKGDFTEDIRKALTYLHWAIGEDTRKCEK